MPALMVTDQPRDRFEELQRFCPNVWDKRLRFVNKRVVLFYLVRWCQKQAKTLEPDLGVFGNEELASVAENIAANLRCDGERVERLLSRDGDEWTKLLYELAETTSRRAPQAMAVDLAENALVRIVVILDKGTKPSCANCRLGGDVPGRPECESCRRERRIEGDGNEYVFQSPFAGWSRTIARNIAYDWWRTVIRRPDPPSPAPKPSHPKRGWCKEVEADLPALLGAIDKLSAKKQRSVMIRSLSRSDIDPEAYKRMRALAPPELFEEVGSKLFESDEAIAGHLESTRRRVGANRSAARRKLCEQNPRWEALLDVFMPHCSSRRAHGEEARDG